MLKSIVLSTDVKTMRIGSDILLQSQMVELPAELMQLQLRFTEKMLKASIAEKAMESALASMTSGIDVKA